MKLLFWIGWHEFVNRLKKAMRRPVTYFVLVFVLVYLGFVGTGLGTLFRDIHIDDPAGLIVVITVLIFMAQPSSYLMYARRKGIMFKPSHAHYIFSAPVSPKKILIYGALKNVCMDVILGVVFFISGIAFFSVPFWKMTLVFLMWVSMTAVQELSLIILLYGNDRVSTEKMDRSGKILLGILVLLGLFFVWYFRAKGFSLESVKGILFHPVLKMVPLVGWSLSLYHLLILGPGTVNVIGSGLYIVSTLLLFIFAWKMPCDGGYYEEAAKFADEYQNLRKRKEKGEISTGKEKYRKVKMHMKGAGATAIFYRHLQEYKKAKFFIFNQTDLICFVLAGIMAKAFQTGADGKEMQQSGGLFMLGVLAYVVFCMSGTVGKWEKELDNPYIYLIPESPMKKMWYATLMEHIRSLFDAVIMCLFMGISWKVPIWQVVCSILIYVSFQAVKMYLRIVSCYILGDHFGKMVRELFRMLFMGILMGVGIMAAVVVGMAGYQMLIFPLLLGYGLVTAVFTMFLGAARFEVLEQLE